MLKLLQALHESYERFIKPFYSVGCSKCTVLAIIVLLFRLLINCREARYEDLAVLERVDGCHGRRVDLRRHEDRTPGGERAGVPRVLEVLGANLGAQPAS